MWNVECGVKKDGGRGVRGAAWSSFRTPRSKLRTGFTLVEMLVVIAIILLLLGLVVGAVGQFSKQGVITATNSFLNAIAIAASAYERDCKGYPPSDYTQITGSANATTFGSAKGNYANWNGGELLTQAILGSMTAGKPSAAYDDGKPGAGFKIGTVTYGPYLKINNDQTVQARFDADASGGQTSGEVYNTSTFPKRDGAYVLTMPSSGVHAPILYYRKSLTGKLGLLNDSTEANRIWGTAGAFNRTENDTLINVAIDTSDNASTPSPRIENNPSIIIEGYWALANSSGGPTTGAVEGLTLSMRTAEFILVAAGPDDKFGTADDIVWPGP
ncbi:MAG: prepilin-type N-terminal cleavage/methylation domain-containing protein [Planctomycetes bacterium]|nr:prepilin-type N-terminal cleavage/methylation domain-containing protein [Planctomycetota bacterium]